MAINRLYHGRKFQNISKSTARNLEKVLTLTFHGSEYKPTHGPPTTTMTFEQSLTFLNNHDARRKFADPTNLQSQLKNVPFRGTDYTPEIQVATNFADYSGGSRIHGIGDR